MKTIGLVLSGGGVRGIGHLGVLKALDEAGIKISAISGTSAGAIVAAFYAAGHTPDEIMTIAAKIDFFSLTNINIAKPGLFSMGTFEKIYAQYFSKNTFESLRLPIYVAATDIVKGEVKYFSTGNLAKSLMASSCVPIVFNPIEYEGAIYLDGGILNNFPVEPLIGQCDKIIGVHVNGISHKEEDFRMRDIVDRSFHLALSTAVLNKSIICDLFIEPPEMSKYGIFDMKNAKEIFTYCYNYTKKMNALKDFLNDL